MLILLFCITVINSYFDVISIFMFTVLKYKVKLVKTQVSSVLSSNDK